ncbi:hypothetical protein ACRAWD_11870 [Caulobacter segnis]
MTLGQVVQDRREAAPARLRRRRPVHVRWGSTPRIGRCRPRAWPWAAGAWACAAATALKLGQLYANGGQWDGKQVLPADFIKASVAPHANARQDTDYGYLIWLQTFPGSDGLAHKAWVMSGSGGQKVAIVPDLSLVAVITTTNFSVRQPHAISEKLLAEHILAAVEE